MSEEPISQIAAPLPSDFQTSPTIAKIAEALALAQGEMSGAKKDANNPFFGKAYADLASVIGAIREPLSKHKIAHTQIPGHDAEGEYVDTLLMHASGEWIRGRIRMKPVKMDPQGIGSVITYMRRYSLQAMVGLEAEDDDGNGASNPQQQDRKPQKVPLAPLREGTYQPAPTAPDPSKGQPEPKTDAPESDSITKWQDRVYNGQKKAIKGKRLGDLPVSIVDEMFLYYKDKDCKTQEEKLLRAALLMRQAEKKPSPLFQEFLDKCQLTKVDPAVLGQALNKADLVKSTNGFDFTDAEAKYVLENWKDCLRVVTEFLDVIPMN